MRLQRSIPGLNSRYRGPAFRAIESVLREDPVLTTHVRTWKTREGHPEEYATPSTGMMPLIGLSPIPNPNAALGVDEQRITLSVLVQLFVAGTCFEDIIALWEAVEDAICDQRPFRNTTVREFLCQCIDSAPAGVNVLRPTVPAFFTVNLMKPPKNLFFQQGDGILTCFLRRPSARPRDFGSESFLS